MKTKLILTALLAAGTLSAETLMKYDTAGLPVGATEVTNSAASVANMSSTDLTMTSTLNNKTANSFVAWDWTQSTPAAALANGEYITFSATAGGGYVFNLESIDMNLFYQSSQGDTADWAIYSSIDGFSTAFASGSNLTGAVYTAASVDLNGSEFDSVSGTIEFRLAFGDLPNQWVYAGVSTDNTSGDWPKPAAIQLNGSVIEDEGGGGTEPDIIITSNEVQTVTVYKIVVDTPDGADLSTYYPISSTNLVDGPWADVAHADNPYGPYLVTNLTYSAAVSGGLSFYVKVDKAGEFFGIEVR